MVVQNHILAIHVRIGSVKELFQLVQQKMIQIEEHVPTEMNQIALRPDAVGQHIMIHMVMTTSHGVIIQRFIIYLPNDKIHMLST